MTWSRYGQLLSFTDCSGYVTRYDHDRLADDGGAPRGRLSQYRAYDSRGQLIAVKDTQGHETRYEYNAAGDLTTVIAPDGSRNGTQYDAWEKPSVPRRAADAQYGNTMLPDGSSA